MIRIRFRDASFHAAEFDDGHTVSFEHGWVIVIRMLRFLPRGPNTDYPPTFPLPDYGMNVADYTVAAFPADRVHDVTQEIETKKFAVGTPVYQEGKSG